jgi:Cu/Zn superoxide dismutase
MTVTGTATFTQGATMTTVVINLTACPDGPLVSHLHQVPDCGNDGIAAGNHWVPNGEMLGNYTCAGGTVMHTAMKPTTQWTIGGDAATDLTLHAFVVHEGSDPTPGDRIGCGIPTATQ